MHGEETMQKIFTILSLILFSVSISYSQIPNPGFEQWDSNSTPTGWQSDNQSSYQYIIKSGDAHSGSYSVEGQVISTLGFSTSPSLLSNYFHYTTNSSQLSAWIKFNPAGGDSLVIITNFFNGGLEIAGGDSIITKSYSYWTNIKLNIHYALNEPPDSALIWVYVYPLIGSHKGTKFYLDDFSYIGNTTGINDLSSAIPVNYKLYQNYPNPFNPTTKIIFNLPSAGNVKLIIYNTLGQKVKELINSYLSAGQHNVVFNGKSLVSGIYFYRLDENGRTRIKKMILLK